MREFLEKLDGKGKVVHIKKEVSPKYELPALLKKLDGKTVLFEKVNGSDYRVVGGLCSSRDTFASELKCKKQELLQKIANAIDNPSKPETTANAPCQEVVEDSVDLEKLPITTQGSGDAGPYVTAGILICNDPEYGRNSAFHRLLRTGKNKFTARICERHTSEYLKRAGGELDVAICIGNMPSVLLASAIHTGIEVDELGIANTFSPLKTVKCKTNDIEVPANCEFVLEGKITKETAKEGPFIDMTGTYDMVRDQPVIEITKITHRKEPIYQALASGFSEHRLLMGMPREPTMFKEVSKVCDCINVSLTTGGCSWLHGIVQIRKKSDDEPKKAIEAAFKGHSSMKHVVIVDEDIDIYDINDIEWAIATRFQAEKDAVIFNAKGSSLDPSCDCKTRITSKVGIDATVPLDRDKENFMKAEIVGEEKIKLDDYL